MFRARGTFVDRERAACLTGRAAARTRTRSDLVRRSRSRTCEATLPLSRLPRRELARACRIEYDSERGGLRDTADEGECEGEGQQGARARRAGTGTAGREPARRGRVLDSVARASRAQGAAVSSRARSSSFPTRSPPLLASHRPPSRAADRPHLARPLTTPRHRRTCGTRQACTRRSRRARGPSRPGRARRAASTCPRSRLSGRVLCPLLKKRTRKGAPRWRRCWRRVRRERGERRRRGGTTRRSA